MRLHGLVSLAFLGLSSQMVAQDLPAPQLLQTPNSQPALIPEGSFAAPVPLPALGKDPEVGANLEDELRQLRNELKTFEVVREDVARSAKALDAENDRAANQQRQELLDLLTKLATTRVTRKPGPVDKSTPQATRPAESLPPPPSVTDEPSSPPMIDDVVDAFALGKVLFRSGDYAAAEQAFRKVKPTDENRLMVKYLIATCLRKRSQWQPALDAYRTIADSDQDPVLRDLARWQIDNIRWHQETESQLEQMRTQREKRSESPKTRSTGTNGSRS